MAKSVVDSFLESDEPLIPSDAKSVSLQTLPNQSGISVEKQDPKRKLGIAMALVAPYATPDWDKPITREVANKPKTEDPALEQILGECKEDRSITGLRLAMRPTFLKSSEPASTLKESTGVIRPKPPLFVEHMEQSGKLEEKVDPFMGGLAGIKTSAPIENSTPTFSSKPSVTKEQLAESLLDPLIGSPDPVATDPKIAAARNASAFRGLFGR